MRTYILTFEPYLMDGQNKVLLYHQNDEVKSVVLNYFQKMMIEAVKAGRYKLLDTYINIDDKNKIMVWIRTDTDREGDTNDSKNMITAMKNYPKPNIEGYVPLLDLTLILQTHFMANWVFGHGDNVTI